MIARVGKATYIADIFSIILLDTFVGPMLDGTM